MPLEQDELKWLLRLTMLWTYSWDMLKSSSNLVYCFFGYTSLSNPWKYAMITVYLLVMDNKFLSIFFFFLSLYIHRNCRRSCARTQLKNVNSGRYFISFHSNILAVMLSLMSSKCYKQTNNVTVCPKWYKKFSSRRYETIEILNWTHSQIIF